MKIAILGPVYTTYYYGGVATFDEGIAAAFTTMGHEVILFTSQKGTIKNANINIKQCSKWKLVAEVKKFKPDVILASLQYAIYFCLFHSAIKVMFLHGFFNFESYGIIKTLLSVRAMKFMANSSDLIIANSNFTAMINRRIWNIPVNGIAYLGIDPEFQEQIDKIKGTKKQKGKILFVGRLAKSKRVDRIIKAIAELKKCRKSYELIIAGDGPESAKLQQLAQKLQVNAKFLGRVSHREVYKLYREAEIFISLNDGESFGITFVESLLSNCKIVCPNTGGQVEFLEGYHDRVQFISPLDDKNIADGIDKLLSSDVPIIDTCKVNAQFNYLVTASKIIHYIEEING